MVRSASLTTKSNLRRALIPPRGTSAAQAAPQLSESQVASELSAFVLEVLRNNPDVLREVLSTGVSQPIRVDDGSES